MRGNYVVSQSHSESRFLLVVILCSVTRGSSTTYLFQAVQCSLGTLSQSQFCSKLFASPVSCTDSSDTFQYQYAVACTGLIKAGFFSIKCCKACNNSVVKLVALHA